MRHETISTVLLRPLVKLLSRRGGSQVAPDPSPGGTEVGSLGREPQGGGARDSPQPRRGGSGFHVRSFRPSGAGLVIGRFFQGLTPLATYFRRSAANSHRTG
jgi:hypothetical protein